MLGRGPFRIVHQRAELGEGVFAVHPELDREREMVHAGQHRIEVLHPAVERQAQVERRADPLVAQTDSLHRRLPRHRPAQRGERVRHVDEPGIGSDRVDVACDVEQHRHAAQRPHDPAGAHAVADGLTDAVTPRDLDVVLHAVEAAHREARDHEIGAGQGALAVGFGDGGETDIAAARDLTTELRHELQSLGVEIVEHDLGTGQRRRVREVTQEPRRPVIATAADDHDARAHARSLRGRSSGPQGDLDLDLDRAAARQRGNTDRRTAVPAGGAEHVGEQTARAVDDGGLLGEAGARTPRSPGR